MTAGTPDTHALGLDVGAVSVSAVETGPDGGVVRSFYELHHGDSTYALRHPSPVRRRFVLTRGEMQLGALLKWRQLLG